MNSSKLRGGVDAPEPGASATLRAAGSSATPSAQQSTGSFGSHTSALFSLTAGAAAAVSFTAGGGVVPVVGFSGPKRASIAPIRHSFSTWGGRPYNAPWNG